MMLVDTAIFREVAARAGDAARPRIAAAILRPGTVLAGVEDGKMVVVARFCDVATAAADTDVRVVAPAIFCRETVDVGDVETIVPDGTVLVRDTDADPVA
jgi:hypothetical protein